MCVVYAAVCAGVCEGLCEMKVPMMSSCETLCAESLWVGVCRAV